MRVCDEEYMYTSEIRNNNSVVTRVFDKECSCNTSVGRQECLKNHFWSLPALENHVECMIKVGSGPGIIFQ